MELYYCFGCNPIQSEYIGKDERGLPSIRICESYAQELYESAYEKCGLNLKVRNTDITVAQPAAEWNFNYELTEERQVVIPNKVFRNASALLNAMKPPYFENYQIEIVNNGTCFSNSGVKVILAMWQVLFIISVSLHLYL